MADFVKLGYQYFNMDHVSVFHEQIEGKSTILIFQDGTSYSVDVPYNEVILIICPPPLVEVNIPPIYCKLCGSKKGSPHAKNCVRGAWPEQAEYTTTKVLRPTE